MTRHESFFNMNRFFFNCQLYPRSSCKVVIKMPKVGHITSKSLASKIHVNNLFNSEGRVAVAHNKVDGHSTIQMITPQKGDSGIQGIQGVIGQKGEFGQRVSRALKE